MNKVLVFHKVFFGLTETFVHRQVQVLESYFEVVLLASKFENKERFPIKSRSQYQYDRFTNWFDRARTGLSRHLLKRALPFSIGTSQRVSRIIKSAKINVIHAHYGWSGLRILSVAKKHNIPLVVSFHGKDASQALAQKAYVEKLPQLFDYAAGIIVCSPHMLQTLPLDNFRDKVHLIPYGIDVDEFSPGSRNESQFIQIVHVGRITGKKGVPDLVRVFGALANTNANIQLHILGDGEELEVCQALVANAGLHDRVIFHGAQGKEKVLQIMNEADIFVLNSRVDDDGDMEGLPNALLEAMSLEKAIVSTFHAGIPMVVKNEFNGLLVKERDNEGLKLALDRLIHDKALRIKLGTLARQTVLQDFSLKIMKDRLHDVFKRWE